MSQSDKTLEKFLADLASRSATPGGGSASALVGAVAAALCAMVGRLNDKKDGTPGVLHESISMADGLLERLSQLIDEDIVAFDTLAASWKLPDTVDHSAARQAAVIQATRTPLEIMSVALKVMHLARAGLTQSKKNCLSDAGVAGQLAHAALEGARLNVMINLPGINDASIRSELGGQAGALRAEAAALRRQIDEAISKNYPQP